MARTADQTPDITVTHNATYFSGHSSPTLTGASHDSGLVPRQCANHLPIWRHMLSPNIWRRALQKLLCRHSGTPSSNRHLEKEPTKEETPIVQHAVNTAAGSVTKAGHLIVRSLKKFPKGYPNLAAFTDSDESFMLYRRFGYLQSRILLGKQDQLRCLEEQLDKLDESEMYEEPDNLFTRESQGEERKELLQTAEKKFREYASILGAAERMMCFNRPSDNEHQSVANYLWNRCPVDKKEAEYVRCKEDLISLRPGREYAWLDRSIERLLRMSHCRLVERLFCSKEMKEKAISEHEIYYSKSRIERCSVAIVTLMILFLLIVPIYLLFHIVAHSHGYIGGRANAMCIGVMLVFTLVFSAVMALFTTAKKHEILGAAAAYCAVLVVFLGNVGNVGQR